MLSLMMAILVASYASQASSGAPLVVAGRIDSAAVRHLAKFDISTWEATPWAKDVSGSPRSDVPLLARSYNPRTKLCLYLLAGDQWLPPEFTPSPNDHSGFADIFRALKATPNAWLYGTDGRLWYDNHKINLANRAVTDTLASVYCSLLSTHLFDMVFLDDAHTSIAWTSKPERPLDVERAGFATLAEMDSARLANVERLIARLKASQPCLLVAVNGTGPIPSGADVRMQEGIGRLVTAREAIAQVKQGGRFWIKSECYSPEECRARLSMLRGVAVFAKGEVIISCGPDRSWEPVGR